MDIAILAPIATDLVISKLTLKKYNNYPKGNLTAPFIGTLIKEYLRRDLAVLAITTDSSMSNHSKPFVIQENKLTLIIIPSRKHSFRFNGIKLGRAIDFFYQERKLITISLKKYNPKIVHAHWTYEFAMSAISYSKNSVITIHDNPLVVLQYIPNLYRLIRLLMSIYCFKKGIYFTTVSPYMANSMSRFTKRTIEVIPNPIELPILDTQPINHDTLKICMIVNGWDERKNCETGLLAFKNLNNKLKNIELICIGTAFDSTSPAKDFCKIHSLENVKLLGSQPREKILSILKNTSILLHTSREESFGMVLVEAMSIGIPVVAGKKSGAVPWVVQNGGILVDIESTDDICQALLNILLSKELRNSLSEKAKNSIKSRFAVETVADMYIKYYNLIDNI